MRWVLGVCQWESPQRYGLGNLTSYHREEYNVIRKKPEIIKKERFQMIEKVKMSVGKWDKLEIKQDTSSWPG